MLRNLPYLHPALLVLIFFAFAATAQDAQPVSNDSLAKGLKKVMNELEVLKRFKISGYAQVQFQHADTAGVKTFAGGDFPSDVQNRFTVRRGRLKFSYNGDVTQVVFQIDATERGVNIKDAYLKLSDPWIKWMSLTAGLFVRPFGYELLYSSSQRESPERARMIQVLFPGERDVGAMVSIQPPADNKLHLLKLDGGFVNGAGPNLEFDGRMDAFGRLSVTEASEQKKFNYRAGFSFYVGGVEQTTDTLFKMEEKCFEPDIDSSSNARYSKRTYIGADAEASHKSKLGSTILRAEFAQGSQSATKSLNTSFTRQPVSNVYERKFYGVILYLIQGFFKDKHQLVVKYDLFDPNMDVKGADMQAACGVSSTDLMYHTVGFGYIWNANKFLKLMAYYDLVKNETAEGLGITKDIKDNILTLRAQVKF